MQKYPAAKRGIKMIDKQAELPLLKLIDLNATDVFIGMCLSYFLCAILSRFIRISSTSAAGDRNLPQTMIFLGAIVSLIMAVIGNSLARAFGAIGALSLIRFRTAVKSSSDLAWLFMAISIGMTCGSGYFAIATGATGLFAVFIVLSARFLNESNATKFSMLKLSYSYSEEAYKKITECLQKNTISWKILSEESSDSGNFSEMIIEICLPSDKPAGAILQELGQTSQNIKASVLIN